MRKDEKRRDNENHPGAFLGGGAAGAVAGAAAGALAGPIGAVAGATIGGFAGAKAGESMASMPEEEETFWRENYQSRSYSSDDAEYEDYAPAYKAGYSSASDINNENRSFDEVESNIRSAYERDESSKLEWEDVRDAARDSYDRGSQLREERLRPEKERVDSDEVSLRKEVVTENQTMNVPVEREEVVVERRPLSGQSSSRGEILDRNGEEIARVRTSEERVRLEKDTVPIEEVSLRKETVQDDEEVSGTVRREEARIDKSGNSRVRDERR